MLLSARFVESATLFVCNKSEKLNDDLFFNKISRNVKQHLFGPAPAPSNPKVRRFAAIVVKTKRAQ